MSKPYPAPHGLIILILVWIVPATIHHAHGIPDEDQGDDTSTTRQELRPSTQPGVILVKVKEDTHLRTGASKTGISSLDRLGTKYRVNSIERTFPFLDAPAFRHRLFKKTRTLRRVYTIHYEAPVPPKKVVSSYTADPHIALAEPRYMYPTTELPKISKDVPTDPETHRPVPISVDPQVIPNDSLYEQMTHLPQIRMPEAWEVIKGENSEVIVAIVDGGTEWQHPDLEANVWTNSGEIGGNNIDDDNNGYVDDVHGWDFGKDIPDPTGTTEENTLHGTAVTGVVGAVANNRIGIAGNSWNATYMPLAAGCENPSFDGSICYGYQGVVYAAVNGADVINASWSGLGFSELQDDVIQAALEQGALIVAAGGNAGVNIDRTPTFPASVRSVLTVGAVEKSSDQVTDFSNFGESVDVFAPGIGINTTVPEENDTYITLNGTSFATPLVSGIAALVTANFPDYSPAQVREQVRVTSERIDDENTGFNGFLGQGLVNAHRALTLTDIPSVRVTETVMNDADSDSLAEPGETVDLSITFTNFLADASSVTAELAADDTVVTVTSGSASLGGLSTGATAEATFTFEVSDDAPQGRQAVFYVEISADDHNNTDVLRVVVNPSQAIEHTTDPLQVSITNEGNIGFVTFADSPGPGIGFRFKERNLLFEGGLLVGTGPDQISDCIRGSDPRVLQEDDFVPQPGSQLEITSPGEFTTEEGLVTLVDDAAETPLNISVRQETYMDESEANNEFIVFRYIITNQDTATKTDLHGGIFIDWDISADDPSTDHSKFNQERRLGYVFDGPSPSALGGLKLLTTEGELSYRAIDNPEEIYQETAGGFTSQEKWNYMSKGIQQTGLTNTDVSHLMASGPYSIEPGASIEIAFAIIGGESEANLLENAANAQTLWDETLSKISVDTEKPAPAAPTAFSLDTIYPNPTAASATFTYQVAEPAKVTLKVYDLLGREVRTLVADRRRSGSYEVTWNGLNELGHKVANGLYLVRLTVSTGARELSQTRKLMLVR